jgi:arylsulfatase A-like enzyme
MFSKFRKLTLPGRLPIRHAIRFFCGALVVAMSALGSSAQAKKPNILVIFGDDIGQTNISAYGDGVVGYRTPNIDRIAHEGMKFTDYYGENSCTAGRSTFITGQSAKRTGLSKVGLPGANAGLQPRDVTLAQALKPLGYATGQFGKNHLGDRDEFLPTNHGFDEFYGNLYHLNAEEEPERPYWKSVNDADPTFKKFYEPRGVLHTYADGKIEDTGPLTAKRMETTDEDFENAAEGFIKKQADANKPFFVWMNFTHMHAFTHVSDAMKEQSGMPGNEYADGMVQHDKDVGKLLDFIDQQKLTDNTIVVYSTDNGPNQFSWPDAATTPFRSEKDTNWEGAFRVPAMVRWPGHIKAGVISNEMFSGMDWFPTLLAAAGNSSIKEDLLKGTSVGGKTFKVHLDGYNQLPYLTGQQPHSARHEFFYFNDDGQLVATRVDDWKWVWCEQRVPGGMQVWANPFTCLRFPKIFNLRMDPFERADVVSDVYYDWMTKNAYLGAYGVKKSAELLQTFLEYPPSQIPDSFSVDQIEERIDAVNRAKAGAQKK